MVGGDPGAAHLIRPSEVHAYSPRWVVQEVINAVTRIDAGTRPTPQESARDSDVANLLRFDWRESPPDTGAATPNDRLERYVAVRLSQLLKGREVLVEVRRREGPVPRFARPRIIAVPPDDLRSPTSPQPGPQTGGSSRPRWRGWVLTGDFEIAVRVCPMAG